MEGYPENIISYYSPAFSINPQLRRRSVRFHKSVFLIHVSSLHVLLIYVLSIQSSPYFITCHIIDAQGRCRAFCQQQETTDWKQSLHDGASGFETNSANIKLPKIPLPKFTRQSPIEWVSFWDQFTAAVDENQSLHDVQKLAYLKSFLLGPAAKSIQGYTLTEDYYSLVADFVKKRFGKKRLIIQAHMDAIIGLLKFDTMENNEVRSFLDTLKSNLR